MIWSNGISVELYSPLLEYMKFAGWESTKLKTQNVTYFLHASHLEDSKIPTLFVIRWLSFIME